MLTEGIVKDAALESKFPETLIPEGFLTRKKPFFQRTIIFSKV
jgi:hypothetical protein